IRVASPPRAALVPFDKRRVFRASDVRMSNAQVVRARGIAESCVELVPRMRSRIHLPCLTLALLAGAAGAQSEETLAALEAHHPDAAPRAEAELKAAEQAHGPDVPSLSLLVGFLRFSSGDASGGGRRWLKEA